MRKRKITPFLIVLPVAIFLSLFYTLYYLYIENRAGSNKAGLLLLSLTIGLSLLFFIERLLLQRIAGVKKFWIVELLLITSFVLFYKYKRSNFYYTVSDDTKWFATFKKSDASRKSHYSFPFNKEISIDSNQVLAISRADIGEKREAVRSAGYKWRGYTWRCRQLTVKGKRINLNIFCRPRTELTYTDYKQMEQLLLIEINK